MLPNVLVEILAEILTKPSAIIGFGLMQSCHTVQNVILVINYIIPYITVYFTTTYHYFITTKQGCGCVFIFRGLCGLSSQAAIAREECCQQNEQNDKIMVGTREVNCNRVYVHLAWIQSKISKVCCIKSHVQGYFKIQDGRISELLLAFESLKIGLQKQL